MKLFEKPMIVTFEGLDGSGKSFLMEAFTKRLQKDYKDEFIEITEPGCSSIEGFDPREILRKNTLSNVSEVLMHALYRRENVLNLIKPALDSGKSVIQDRFALSTYCYNVYPFTEEDSDVMDVFMGTMPFVVGENLPEPITFLLNTPKDIRYERMEAAGKDLDRYELDLEYQDKVMEAYEQVSQSPSVVTLDGTKSIEELVNIVIETIAQYQTKQAEEVEKVRAEIEEGLEQNESSEDFKEPVKEDSKLDNPPKPVDLASEIEHVANGILHQLHQASMEANVEYNYSEYKELMVRVIKETLNMMESPEESIVDPKVVQYLTDQLLPTVYYGHQLKNITANLEKEKNDE